MSEFTGSQKAWITNSWTTTKTIQAAIDAGNYEGAMNSLHFTSHDMSCSGWVEVGIATTVVTLYPESEITEKLADGLRAQIKEVQAESHLKIMQLEDKLQQLLCLPKMVHED